MNEVNSNVLGSGGAAPANSEGSRKVATYRGGPLLVLGGPGSGKTTALERRYLDLASSEVAPHRVLLLCTNRAYSLDAKDRLFTQLPHRASIEVPVYTWHALTYHLVSRYYPKLGHRESPVLLTGPEQWGVVRELLASEQRVDWPRWGERLTERGFIDEVADFVLRVQQKLMTDADLDALSLQRSDWGEVVRFYYRYRDYLKEEARLDYAGLLRSAVELLRGDEEVAASLRLRFPHVLADNGQELSIAHRSLLVELETSNLVVAADPDSGIEGFRGAEPDWVFGFGAVFGTHETVILDRSWRIGPAALKLTAGLISHNDPKASHRLSVGSEHETQLESRLYSSSAAEVEDIAREIRHIHLSEGVPWDRIAVLVSQPRFLLSPLERALDRWEVPYAEMSGDRSLASQPAVASFLDLVRVSLKSQGWESTLPALLTTGLVGLDYTERRRLERSAWQEHRLLSDVVEEADSAQEFRKLRDIVQTYADRADECFWQVYSASRWYQDLKSAGSADPTHLANHDLDALVVFSHALGRFVERRHGKASIVEYLSEAARADFGGDPWLKQADAQDSDRVALLSFHAAAGREWDTVFVAGCLDTWIPKGRRAQGLFDPFGLEVSEVADREVEAIADDRRTFYVAATRGRKKTVFTVSPGPSGRGRPTRFLSELGIPPVDNEAPRELPPLTDAEMRSRLRRVLNDSKSLNEEKVAALLALSEVPGTEPSRWYGRWDWSEGAVPLALPGEFRTSYSRLGIYENCGLQYVLQSVLGLDPASTESMKFGTWMHALFQAVHDGLINDIPTLISEYRSLFDDTVFPNRAIANQYRSDGEQMLRRFWENEFTQENVLTEHDFEFPFEGAILRGRIDRIDTKGNVLKLTDYKTSRWAPSRPEAQKSLQLAIYFLAARNDEKLRALGEPQVARLVFPGATWADGSIIELAQNPSQADDVLTELPRMIRDVIDEKFSPSVEADCHFCKMRPLCPIWPDGREVMT